jgi:two-component sensor histidine kinase
LIKTIARQLRGRVEVDGNNGTRTTIVFGLSRRKEAAVS